MSTVVMVPGGFLGPWIWEQVEASLRASGVATFCPRLTSVVETTQEVPGDLYTDVAAVRKVLDDADPPVVLCGHSYGGAVITQAAAGPHPAVEHLVYLAAAAPDVGQSLADLAPAPAGTGASHDDGAEQIEFHPGGTISLTPNSAIAGLFNDCPTELADQAVARLRFKNPAVNRQPVAAAAWREIPTTYVRCTSDEVDELVSPQFLDHVELVELPTGHCPQWSRPDLVARLLLNHARHADRG